MSNYLLIISKASLLDVMNLIVRIVIYNHLEINVITHHSDKDSVGIVGFEVEPFSIAEGPNRSYNDPKHTDG